MTKQTHPSAAKAVSITARVLSPRGRGSAESATDPDRLLSLFADNMRRIRVSKELSQEELADLADLDRTYVSGIERKKRNLGIRNIQRIADALGVDVRQLLSPPPD